MSFTHEQSLPAFVTQSHDMLSRYSTRIDGPPQIRDYPAFLNELAQVLRPRGVILVGDGEMQLYDEQKRPMSFSDLGQPGFSWTHMILFAAYTAMKNKGGSVDSPLMGPTWLREIDSLTDVGWQKVFIPIGPWYYGGTLVEIQI